MFFPPIKGPVFWTPSRRIDKRILLDMAALDIECGGTWITTDREYARFPGLRWRGLA